MRKYLWISSLCLYGLSMLSPVYTTLDVHTAVFGQGFALFVLGALMAFLSGGLALIWFANPFYIAALITSRKYPVVSLVLALIAISIGLCFLNGGKIEARGQTSYIAEILFGYWLWIGSMLVLLFASVFKLVKRKTS